MKRILQHVKAKDFKKTRQRHLDEQKVLCEEKKIRQIQEKREREEIDKLSAPFKSSWKTELFPEKVEIEESVEEVKEERTKLAEKWKYNWRESLIEKPEEEIVETVFEPITFIKNKKIGDIVFDNLLDASNWREELIDEGMSSKDFSYLYGYGISIFNVPITSTIQNPVQSTLAQDIVNASADATDYAFGSQFPGSYVNTIGDPVTSELSPEEKPDSTTKVDAVARISPGDTDNETKKDWGGDQDGAVLPSDPWNYNPTPILADGEDYEQVIRLTVNSNDPTQIKVYSINLSAGQTYNFKTLDFTNPEYSSSNLPGYNNSFNSDSVLSLQDVNGNVVAQNDDIFPGTYNQYVASNPGDTYPEGPGGEPEYYDGFGWTAAPINYNTTEVPGDESEWYYILNSNITYTPTQSGTYYLAIRDYFDISPSGATPTAMHYKLVVRGSAPQDSQGGPPTEKPGGSTQDTTAAWNLGAPVSAFVSNSGQDKLKKGKELGINDFKSAADFSAFKAGGGNAALAQGKTLQQVIVQGKKNLGAYDSSDPVNSSDSGASAAALGLGALTGVFSTKDLTNRIQQRLPGFTIGKFEQTGKGDHYTAPILDKNGNPVIDKNTGKPIRIGGGIRGVNKWSNSAMGTLTNAINTIKQQSQPTITTSQTSNVTVTRTKPSASSASARAKYTDYKSGAGPKPTSGTPSSFRSLSRGGSGGSASGMITPVDPFDYPSDPLGGYTWDKKSGRYIANSYTPYTDKIKDFIRENKKMKTFNQFKQELYPGQPSPNGFPDNPPPEMMNGYHPEYGKTASRLYNTLDKTSAMSMPPTGNPEIDKKVAKAKQQPK